ncbi:UNVERIFIED_ORG: ribose transport system substrate-binding protein [Paraburkholderia sediminicola]|nr:ribose transport system substrate-binding protein [Paraburkholderia sediminicola]
MISLRTSVFSLVMLIISGIAAKPSSAQVGDLKDPQYKPTSTQLTKPGEFKKKPPYNIVLAMPGLFTTWLIQQTEEVRHEATLHPEIAKLTVISSDSNAARQAADLEDQITKGVDAIVVSPVSSTAINAQIAKAVAKGIPVVTFTATASSDQVSVSVLSGGAPEGKIMGDWLAKQLGGKGSIWAFRGIAGNTEDTDRYAGLAQSLKVSKLQVSAEVYADWNYAKGKQACESLLLSGKPVDGIWASGGEMTRGCLEVFHEVGKPPVPVTGEGNNGFLRAAQKSGGPFVAYIYPPSLGPIALRAALLLLEGDQMYRSYWSNGGEVITRENLTKYYRPDLNDSYWVGSLLPDAALKRLYQNK